MTFRSVYDNQHDILAAIVALHCPEGFDADITYGNGQFWKGPVPKPPHCFDLEPLEDGVMMASSVSLPVTDECWGSVVFDPPFLTYVKAGRQHKDGKVKMTQRFGGYWTYQELAEHYQGTLQECRRVLRKKGVLVVKCQDIIHNHRMHATHVNVVNWAEQYGFRLKDLFVLPAKHRMPSPQKGTQRHARIHHSYFLVTEKQ